MKKKANTEAAEITTESEVLKADAAGKAEAKADNTETSRVYCGPSVRGVAKQYTVFTGETPELLAGFVKKHPAAGALIVPIDRFADVRRKLETAGTAEAILYKQIKSEL